MVHASLERATIDQGTKRKRIPKAVYVRCYTDRQAFETALLDPGDNWLRARYTVAYYAGGSTINMRASTCYLAHQFSGGVVTQDSAGAFKTLLHEALHRQGFHNERETDEYAIVTMAAAGQLVRYSNIAGSTWDDWEASRPAGARAMRLAWQQTQRYGARAAPLTPPPPSSVVVDTRIRTPSASCDAARDDAPR